MPRWLTFTRGIQIKYGKCMMVHLGDAFAIEITVTG